MTIIARTPSIIGEPEVVEDVLDAAVAERSAAWRLLKEATEALRMRQQHDGSLADPAPASDAAATASATALVERMRTAIRALAPAFPHDAGYLAAVDADLARWVADGFGVPDFHDALVAFDPVAHRADGIRHLVVFPMYTQNGSPDRLFEALVVETIWPASIARLEETFTNRLFLSLRLVDFTPGYDTDSATLFPETISVRELPEFTWGGIFQDREAARFRRVVEAAAGITRLELLPHQRELLADQAVAEETFVMWDLIHDRSHMRGDLPFDPFMIKQRMPYFLYSLEELRCDLATYRATMSLEGALDSPLADHVRSAILFDRLFRFPLTGDRIRNYDGLGGQLLFAWLHRRGVLHWTDTQLAFDWDAVPEAVLALSDAIDELYWRSIDRPKTAHWLAAYELIRGTLAPHPASRWARGLSDEILAGPPRGYTDAVLDDEFPLSMFYEALGRKLGDVIASTRGITP